jgi:hypothetical protein
MACSRNWSSLFCVAIPAESRWFEESHDQLYDRREGFRALEIKSSEGMQHRLT